MMFINVDLPAPLGPRRPYTPGVSVTLKSSSAFTVPFLYVLLIFVISSLGILFLRINPVTYQGKYN